MCCPSPLHGLQVIKQIKYENIKGLKSHRLKYYKKDIIEGFFIFFKYRSLYSWTFFKTQCLRKASKKWLCLYAATLFWTRKNISWGKPIKLWNGRNGKLHHGIFKKIQTSHLRWELPENSWQYSTLFMWKWNQFFSKRHTSSVSRLYKNNHHGFLSLRLSCKATENVYAVTIIFLK